MFLLFINCSCQGWDLKGEANERKEGFQTLFSPSTGFPGTITILICFYPPILRKTYGSSSPTSHWPPLPIAALHFVPSVVQFLKKIRDVMGGVFETETTSRKLLVLRVAQKLQGDLQCLKD